MYNCIIKYFHVGLVLLDATGACGMRPSILILRGLPRMPTTSKTLQKHLQNGTSILCAIISTLLEKVMAFWMNQLASEEVGVHHFDFNSESCIYFHTCCVWMSLPACLITFLLHIPTVKLLTDADALECLHDTLPHLLQETPIYRLFTLLHINCFIWRGGGDTYSPPPHLSRPVLHNFHTRYTLYKRIPGLISV